MTMILESATRSATGEPWPLLDDLAYLCSVMVNVYFVGPPHAGDREWVLIDAGLAGSADRIARAAGERFGPGSRPSAIILTHGHFDHVGALEELAQRWDAPIYAHTLELPYLTGQSSYVEPDPSVGGGLIASLSWTFSRGPIDLGSRVNALPDNGLVPGLPGWRWIFTPGHTPGHVALFRDVDRTLIAGDAFVTTKQESAMAVFTQRRELNGPPMYFTPDWESAAKSVAILADLDPEVAATGHGEPLRGGSMRADLHDLARDFQRRAVPLHGRYVHRPAETEKNGVLSNPSNGPQNLPNLLLGVSEISTLMREFLGKHVAMK